MIRTLDQMIEKSISEGYELLSDGNGKYDEAVEHYRAQGYDVRAWYLSKKAAYKSWVLYGKKKSPRGRKATKQTVNYEALTVKDLKKKCQQYKIAGYSKMNKLQMVEVLSKVG